MRADEIENTLRAQSLPIAVPQGEDWVAPAYQGLSIANLASTIAALLGVDLPGALPALPRETWNDWAAGLRRVVLVIMDGLGYPLLRSRLAAGDGEALARVADAGSLIPLTSVFPSTTAAALVSLQTGVAPATHGWLAWEMYLREVGTAANGILLCPIWSRHRDLLLDWGLRPETLIKVPTLASCLGASGIQTAALASRQFEGSGYTQMLYRGMAKYWGHAHASDFWTLLRRILLDTSDQRAFVSAYWSGIDTIGHSYGPDSDYWQAEFRTMCHLLEHEFLARLSPAEREGTALLITADHGQLNVPPDQVIRADDDPVLSGHLLVPVVGESRAAFLHPRPGRADLIREHLTTGFPGRFEVVSSAAAMDSGLFGSPTCDESYSRSGELLVLGRGRTALLRTRPRLPLLGKHGGLSADEMLVPLVATRLEAL
ncbi:MAG TPA: alkaline phosphatase family protein [Anaerolineae bacterium]|nr:alkaline phosphatase family protein [Anaerolineae bacterium]